MNSKVLSMGAPTLIGLCLLSFSLSYAQVCTPLTPPPPPDGRFDVRSHGAAGDGTTDDTLCVQAAAAAAAGKVLWFPKGYAFALSAGVYVSSGTTVTGGGTVKYLDNSNSTRLLQIEAVSDVTVSGLTFDGNIDGQVGWNEHRHAIGIQAGSSRVTVEDCTFVDLIGDGVYIGAVDFSGNCPTHVRVQGNRFYALTNPDMRNRVGVGVICASAVQVKDNLFVGMARDTMPGAIDLEPNASAQHIWDVAITGNQVIGVAPCLNQVGIAISNTNGADLRNILVAQNTIRGCLQSGIIVLGTWPEGAGATDADRPVAVVGNTITDIGPTDPARPVTGIGIIAAFGGPGSCLPSDRGSSNAVVSDNTVRNIANNAVGIAVSESDATITGNYVTAVNHWGIWVEERWCDTNRVIVSGNHVSDCGSTGLNTYGGIMLWGSDNVITSNHISSDPTQPKTQTGIYVPYGGRNVIAGNVISGVGFRSINVGGLDKVGGVPVPQIWGSNHLDNSAPDRPQRDFGGYPPAGGIWQRGSVTYNPEPDLGEPFGWVCSGSANPCTWTGFGFIGQDPAATYDAEWDTAAEINARTTDDDFVLGSDASVTRDAEWDTAAEINARTTDDDFVLGSDASVTRDAEWDTAAEINTRTTDADFVTTIPAGAIVAFVATNPTGTNFYAGPNTARSSPTLASVALGVPALTAAKLYCKSTVSPGSARNWTMTVLDDGGATPITCPISGTGTACSSTSSSHVLADASELALRVTRSGNPTTNAVISCSLGVGP